MGKVIGKYWSLVVVSYEAYISQGSSSDQVPGCQGVRQSLGFRLSLTTSLLAMGGRTTPKLTNVFA